jgi:hypothetical protein
LQALYEEGGARRFLVVGVGALGCVTITLARAPADVDKDLHGCVVAMDDIARNCRQQMLDMLQDLATLHNNDSTDASEAHVASYIFLHLYSAMHHIVDHAFDLGK